MSFNIPTDEISPHNSLNNSCLINYNGKRNDIRFSTHNQDEHLMTTLTKNSKEKFIENLPSLDDFEPHHSIFPDENINLLEGIRDLEFPNNLENASFFEDENNITAIPYEEIIAYL